MAFWLIYFESVTQKLTRDQKKLTIFLSPHVFFTVYKDNTLQV